MKHLLLLVACAIAVAGFGPAQPATAARPLLDRVVDRIVRSALLREAVPAVGEPAIDAHARNEDEPIDVSIARLLVFRSKAQPGDRQRANELKSSAELAGAYVKVSLDLFASNTRYVADIVELASLRQEARNTVGDADALELRSHQEFGAADARDVMSIVRLITPARDTAALDKARSAVRSQLERMSTLIEPFVGEPPASAEVLASRQRIAALLPRRTGGR